VARKNREREFAIIGLGRFGGSLARRLEQMGETVLGIDRDPHRAKELADEISEVLVLDASDPDALAQADITAFQTVIIAIAEDFETSALVTASLKEMGIQQVICQASTRRHRDILLRIGADRVVLPSEESGIQLADELSIPGMLNHLPLNADYNLIEIQTPAGMLSKKVQACEQYEVNVLLILRSDEMILSPDPETRLQQGDILVVVGEKQRLATFSALT
jgi:trk system potassium uptake protein TrkA